MIKVKNKMALGVLMMAGTIMLSACTTDIEEPQAQEQAVPLSFSTYMSRSASSRAAATGSITDAQSLAQKGGFGVFAYYTEGTRYTAGQADYLPNFFYNQLVEGTDAATPVWTYAPIKYWPNNNSQADNAGAVGENKGLVSFFAYAPYTSELGSTGITEMTANTAKSDPVITYKLAANGENVDLLWGTSGTTSSIAGTWTGRTDDNTGEDLLADPTATPAVAGNGKVNVNLTKQATDGKVAFNFKHALAKMGLKVQLDLDDNHSNITGGELFTDGNKTKVSVESVTITTDGVDGAPKIQGRLNLATGEWEVDDVTTAFSCSLSGSELNEDILDPGESSSATTPYSTLSTNGTTWVWDKTGVQTANENGVAIDPMDVYASTAATKPILFIPGTTPKFKVNIVYYVNTIDPNLQKYVSRVKNSITKEITFSSAVDMGKAYNLVMHLGLTIVKFSVEVDNWDEDSGTSTVNLPINVSDGSTPEPRIPDTPDPVDEDDSDAHQQVDKSQTGVNASTAESKKNTLYY